MRMGATRTKQTYLHAQYLRIRSRRGAKKAIGAAAAAILTAVYRMLKNGTLYQDLGAKPLRQTRPRQARLATREPLKEPGFAVQITPIAA